MALNPFTVYEGATKKTVSGIDSIVTNTTDAFVVDTSATISNSNRLDSIVCNIMFSNFLPDPYAATSKGWKVRAVIEAEGQGWHLPVATMFDPIGNPDQGLRYLLNMQPNTFNIDEGVSLDIFDGAGNITRISRQQGVLQADFRIIMEVNDAFAGTQHALTSFDVEIFGEIYNHAG